MEPANGRCPDHGIHALQRRGFLKLAGFAGIGWLTPVAELLAQQAGQQPPQSVIVLWLAGGPSQLETFDPHPGTRIAGETRAINTSVRGIQLAEGLPRLAEEMAHFSIIRSMFSREGDHERGTYTLKTGYRPDPTVGAAGHPSLGAIICQQLPIAGAEIPRHISILPNQWPARGGFIGDPYDAFQLNDPASPLPDVRPQVPAPRDRQRVQDLLEIEKAFALGRFSRVEATGHRSTIERARLMMTSEQLRAFDTSQELLELRRRYGETPFGRGCLAARRLIEVGVRCVEVTLDGWDTHVNNYSLTRSRLEILDPAFSTLIQDLRDRDLYRRTIVLCLGEFGRTPTINPAGGRDHWPDGFSVAIGGGRIRPGHVVGATSPQGDKLDPTRHSVVTVGDLHATVLAALGIDHRRSNISPVGRPIRLAEGEPVRELLVS